MMIRHSQAAAERISCRFFSVPVERGGNSRVVGQTLRLREALSATCFFGATGYVFAKVLEHAGVYKRTEEGKKAFMRFVESVK